MVEILTAISSFFSTKWTTIWNAGYSGREYKNHFKLEPKGFAQDLMPRRKNSIISRLRMQCSCLAAHLHKINIHASGLCDVCNKPETTNHFLFECISTYSLRLQLFSMCAVLKVKPSIGNVLTIRPLQDMVYNFCISSKSTI